MILFVWTRFFRILWIYFSIYLLVCSYVLNFYTLFCTLFFQTGITFARLRNDGKSLLLTEALTEGWTKSLNISAFSLVNLVGTSVSWQDLQASKQTVSGKSSFFPTFEKLNKSFDFGILSIAFILGWYLYFKIAFKTGSLILL